MRTILDAARRETVFAHPFMAVGLYRLKLKECGDIPTADTDGKALRVNPEWFAALPPAERIGVLMHETMHCLSRHHRRRGDRDPEAWNIATDIVINGAILRSGGRLPVGALRDSSLELLSPEQIYAALSKTSQQEIAELAERSSQATGTVSDGTGNDDDDADDDGWAVAAAETKAVARIAGARGSPFVDVLDASLRPAPTNPWDVLREFFVSISNSDTSWARPNRRYAAAGLYLPGPHGHRLGTVAICIDVSGSIRNDTFLRFCSEIDCLMREMNPERLVVIQADVDVLSEEELLPGDEISVTRHGRGGTSFVQAVERADSYNPQAIVYLTDGCGDFPKHEPSSPIIWVVTTAAQVPYGRRIDLI